MDIIDVIDEIDTNPYVLTTLKVNNHVLRRHPPTKISTENPGSWWRLYQVTQVNNRTGGYLVPYDTKLVTYKEYVVDVTHARPFYFDPNYVTPLNVEVKDTAKQWLMHDFSDPINKKSLVRWLRDPPSESWER